MLPASLIPQAQLLSEGSKAMQGLHSTFAASIGPLRCPEKEAMALQNLQQENLKSW